MPIDPQEFAQLLGAKIAGEVPDVGGGPFGMARLARLLHQSLTPGQGERPGRPTNPLWATRCKVPMSEATFGKLVELAAKISTPGRKVSPMQVAAQLLEEAVGRVPLKPPGNPEEEASSSSGEQTPSSAADDRGRPQQSASGQPKHPVEIKSKLARGNKRQGQARSGARRDKA